METDEEQVEKLKAWFKENGMSIVFGIIIGVGGLSGYRYWIHVQETTAEQASSHYSQMIEALDAGDGESLQSHAETLISEYDATEYALLARLALAKHHVGRGEFDLAEQLLQQIVGVAAQEPLAYLARARLAAVQLQTDKLEQALATLTVEFPAEFAAQVDELRGDIYSRQGKVNNAIEAYRKAQSASPGPANADFLLQKLNDLGSTG